MAMLPVPRLAPLAFPPFRRRRLRRYPLAPLCRRPARRPVVQRSSL